MTFVTKNFVKIETGYNQKELYSGNIEGGSEISQPN